jgi:hypothetical protein
MNSYDDVLRDAFTWIDWIRKSNASESQHYDEAVAVEGILRARLRQSIQTHMKEEVEMSEAMMRLETDIAELLEPGEHK